MSNTLIKFFSTIILAFTILINGLGNFIGVGDIIPTEPAEENIPDVTFTLPAETITNVDMILDYYNDAYDKTGYVSGNQTMQLDGNITCNGTGGLALSVIEPIAKMALENNSTNVYGVPGRGGLTADDVVSAKATYYETLDETVIEIVLKEQVDGLGYYTDGPVSKGIGTPNTSMALEEIGANITSGKDNIVLTYKNPVIYCTIDEGTGEIISGSWSFDLNVTATEFQLSIAGVSGSFEDFDGTVAYEVVI